MFKLKMKCYASVGDDLTKRTPLVISDEVRFYKHLKTTADKYPFLAIMGLRVLTELKLKTFIRSKNKNVTFSNKDTLGRLIAKLPASVPDAQRKILRELVYFENSASHGYEIEKGVAKWALEAIPAFLESLK